MQMEVRANVDVDGSGHSVRPSAGSIGAQWRECCQLSESARYRLHAHRALDLRRSLRDANVRQLWEPVATRGAHTSQMGRSRCAAVCYEKMRGHRLFT